ncbi:iron-containing alcohol dehydrogenase [Bradyrhizobium tropiciagri]|uniref:iron-containing alcohol dehydrogenase n=1 Tax=Bradyrhizobium tropiciagri TaxID=312253 RepID=UPI001BA7034C|nr:iron-containing alcohol dehydrogenase [Bradyrhizobium tropiciagri]MBR0873291.1 iron-containing alcohol dehydrogenase [Bradyrhizobium tropiciagri]
MTTSSADHPKHAANVASGGLALLRQPSVHYGAHAEDAVQQLAKARSSTRILPIVTSSLLGNPVVEATLARLGPSALPVFSDLKPHTPFDVVLSLTETIERQNPDLIVVFGGGSAIDAIKIAGLAASARVRDRVALLGLRSVPDSLGVLRPSPGARSIPIIAVPTTLSAAEFGIIAGATDVESRVKHIFMSETLAPDMIVYDPWLGAQTSLDLWLSTGIRSVDHGIETVLSRDANPFTDALAVRGLALLREGLSAAHADPADIEARHRCQLGTWLSGSSIGRVRYGASHGLGHQLGAIAGVPHGMTSCVLLPAVLAFNAPVSATQQAELAAIFGEAGQSAADAVRYFIESLGLPTRLSQLGVDLSTLPRVAETGLNNAFVKANLRPIEAAADVMTILRAAC